MDESITLKHPHSTQQWLRNLEWDGIKRLHSWLSGALGTPHCHATRIIGEAIITRLVLCANEPGAMQVDTIPVLYGPQGTGKSMLWRTLTGPDKYRDTPFDVFNPRATAEAIENAWIYEVAEIDSLNAQEMSMLKNFVTQKNPRSCLIVGTASTEIAWADSRRLLPIYAPHNIDINWLKQIRVQLFAEAQALYLQTKPSKGAAA